MFDLVFDGQLVPGRELPLVKRNLAQAMKTSEEKIDKLFSGKQIVLKRNQEQSTAEGLQQRFFRLGIQTHIVPTTTPAANHNPSRPNGNAPTTRHNLSLTPIVKPADPQSTPAAQNQNSEETVAGRDIAKASAPPRLGFYFPSIDLSLIIAIFVLLVGLAMSAVFSPYPDGLIRKGFAIGVVIVLCAGRRIAAQWREA